MLGLVKNPLKISFVLLSIVSFALLGFSAYAVFRLSQTQQELSKIITNPTELAKNEVKYLAERVGKLIELPKDEVPTVATVTNLEQLKNQPFFTNARVGDKVLVYAKAKKAILYDPVSNKIVEMGPLIDNTSEGVLGASSAPPVTALPTPTPTPVSLVTKIAIYNGTASNGLAAEADSLLKARMSNITVVDLGSAKKTDYTNTIIIDLSHKRSDIAQTVAGILGGSVGALPVGETAPNASQSGTPADFLVILGSNFPPK